MRFTRLNRLILGAGMGCALSCAIVSCAKTGDSGDSDLLPVEQAGNTDVAPPPEPDASVEGKDASRIDPSFDAAPPRIDCESDPCAESLTTLGHFRSPINGRFGQSF